MKNIFENDFVRNFCEQAGIEFEKPEPKPKDFTFQEFKKHIDRMISSFDFEEQLNTLADKYCCNGIGEVNFSLPNQIDSVIDLLEYILHDEDDWIGYWLFELDCGRKYKPGMVTEADGTDIPLATIEDLWNLLTKEKKNEN